MPPYPPLKNRINQGGFLTQYQPWPLGGLPNLNLFTVAKGYRPVHPAPAVHQEIPGVMSDLPHNRAAYRAPSVHQPGSVLPFFLLNRAVHRPCFAKPGRVTHMVFVSKKTENQTSKKTKYVIPKTAICKAYVNYICFTYFQKSPYVISGKITYRIHIGHM